MSIISRHKILGDFACHSERSAKRVVEESKGIVFLLLMLLLGACDFQGPWSYYPEETEVYQGIYTYGHIVAGESPYVCFSKVYGLKENAAENFAFYDSAYVTVTGKFWAPDSLADIFAWDSVAHLHPVGDENVPIDSEYESTFMTNQNCFSIGGAHGVPGEAYTLRAVFKWDSAGHTVTTEMKAVAKIPTKLHATAIIPPSKKHNSKPVPNDYEPKTFQFLGFPFDILTYKIPMEYDESVRGILVTIKYDNENGGESMNTTMNNMLSAFVEPDSMGYTGITTKKPEESVARGGFTTRMMFAGHNTLDTMEYPGMTLPIGESVIRFYATDQAYADYDNTVLEAIDDSRVVPRSNVENGMGVFSGMLKDSVILNVETEKFITYDYARVADCEMANEDFDQKAWDTKFCRLFQEAYCIDTTYGIEGGGPYFELNMKKTCYPQLVKFAMTRDTTGWSVCLPDTVTEKEKSDAYGDGLKRYCVLSNFKSNGIADCSEMYEQCQVSEKKTNCMEYEWQWCGDRDWNLNEYPQCGTAFVSRYRIEKMNSSILKRVVDKWCQKNPKDSQCGYLH